MNEACDIRQPESIAPVRSTDLLGDLAWSKCHGRKAKTVWFPATPDNQMQLNNIESELICVVDYRGDRDEIWICEVRDGKELSRHNVRTIESIVWESPNESSSPTAGGGERERH